jgi:cbb3-type cytochrome oxidase maturation protein
MSVFFIAVPIALGVAGLAVVAFVLATRSGQFDDLDTPPIRILFDDVEAKRPLANRESKVLPMEFNPSNPSAGKAMDSVEFHL